MKIRIMAVALALASCLVAAQTYTTFVVNPEGGAAPSAINDNGDVVGTYGCDTNDQYRPCGFICYASGKIKHLGLEVAPWGMNDSDEYVGIYNGNPAFYSLPNGRIVKFLRALQLLQ